MSQQQPAIENNNNTQDSVIQFDILESQKENIQPIQEGRSAAALARVFAIPATEMRESQIKERDEFEKRISNCSELDDPIEPFLQYIQWVTENFPQGQTAESGLVQILERCTSEFRDTSYYKNDPRYLKVWLRYITYMDSPREVFIYLARKEIGKNLATFYEEYAKYLEVSGLRRQSKETYEIGIELMARPVERLRRHYLEFCQRLEANPPDPNEPTSSGLSIMRPALALKESSTSSTSDSLFGDSSNNDINNSSHGREGHNNNNNNNNMSSLFSLSSSSPKKKLEVFADPSGLFSGGRPEAVSSGGWDSIGTIASRKKENTQQPSPWVGQTLKSASTAHKKIGKISIFRDNNVSFFFFEITTLYYKILNGLIYIYIYISDFFILEIFCWISTT